MRAAAVGSATLCALLFGCGQLPGKPAPGPEVPRPESVLSARVLYARNCAGCHGVNGYDGPATPLASPLYQAWIDEATLRRVTSEGEQGTMMPAFAKRSGGDLTDEQIDSLVKGMRVDWNHSDAMAGVSLPPYQQGRAANSAHGQQVYASYCARCHGAAGEKIGFAGSVLTPSFLALMTPRRCAPPSWWGGRIWACRTGGERSLASRLRIRRSMMWSHSW